MHTTQYTIFVLLSNLGDAEYCKKGNTLVITTLKWCLLDPHCWHARLFRDLTAKEGPMNETILRMEIDTSIRTANQECLVMQCRLKLICICLPSLSLTHSEWWTYFKWKCMIADSSSLVINILEVKNMSWGLTICYSIWHYLIWMMTEFWSSLVQNFQLSFA